MSTSFLEGRSANGQSVSDTPHLVDHASLVLAEAFADEAALLSTVTRQIAEATGDACIIQLLTPNERALRVVAWHHPIPELRAALTKLIHELGVLSRSDVNLLSAVINEQQTVRISGPPQEVLQVGGISEPTATLFAPVRHLLGVPLVARGRVMGMVILLRVRSEVPHTEAEEGLVRDLADRAALAVDDARRAVDEHLRQTVAPLRQAQKMDAIGELAGSVAHDFNNILTAILSFANFVYEDLPADHPSRPDVHEIIAAGERASTLTRQLLTFSGRQVTKPAIIGLNDFVNQARPSLQQQVSDNIQLSTVLAPRLGKIEIDTSSLEQLLLNLVSNARDAMPHGGRLVIETSDVDVGGKASVQLQVRDTGVGMDDGTLARAFEPFFSTKGNGRGSGLGLSSVYGIVKQSGGEVRVDSVPGKGTTFQLRWPRVPEKTERIEAPTGEALVAGEETVLVVEEDEVVRTAARRALMGQGYRVLEANEGEAALALCRQHVGTIHLLVTDVVQLSPLSGRELVQQLLRFRPRLRVLFISDSSDEDSTRSGAAGGPVQIYKPFTPDTLLKKVRSTLDA